MSSRPVAQIQHKKQFLSKLFLGLVLLGLAVLGLLKLKEILYQPSIPLEYHPFGLDLEEQLHRGVDAELDPDDLEDLTPEDQTRYKKALLLYKTEDALGAYQIIEQIRPLYLKNTSVLELWAKTALASQQDAEVLLTIRRQIHRYLKNSSHPALLLQKALIDEQIENAEDARKTLHQILQESPQYSQAHYELARLELHSKEYTLARRSIQHAITLDSRTREPSYVMLSQLYHDQGMLDSLEILLKLTLQNYPYNPEFNLYQAYLREYQSDLEEAALVYKRMIQIYPEDPRFTEGLKTIGYKEAPQSSQAPTGPALDKVIELLRKLHQKDLGNSGLAYAYYRVLKMNSQPQWVDEAKRIQSQYVSSFPQDTRWNPNFNQENSKLEDQVTQDIIEGNDSLLQLAQTVVTKKQNGHTGRREWEVMAHYLLDWGSAYAQFQTQYGHFDFQKGLEFKDTTQYVSEYEDALAEYRYQIFYVNKQLDHILTHFTEKHEELDLLDELMHKIVGISGKPSKVRKNYCPGFKKFQAYHWESPDNFELLFQFEGKTQEAWLLRLNPEKISQAYPKNTFDICQALPLILDRKP